jgi:enterochelin esterase family protein
MKVIWICAGDKDFALQGAQRLDQILTQHGVKHQFSETPGVHEWKVWRYSLNQFAPLLFK